MNANNIITIDFYHVMLSRIEGVYSKIKIILDKKQHQVRTLKITIAIHL